MKRRHFHVTATTDDQVLAAWCEFTSGQERLEETWAMGSEFLADRPTPAEALATMLVWAWPSSWKPTVDEPLERF